MLARSDTPRFAEAKDRRCLVANRGLTGAKLRLLSQREVIPLTGYPCACHNPIRPASQHPVESVHSREPSGKPYLLALTAGGEDDLDSN
jgi:hypothetical protein